MFYTVYLISSFLAIGLVAVFVLWRRYFNDCHWVIFRNISFPKLFTYLIGIIYLFFLFFVLVFGGAGGGMNYLIMLSLLLFSLGFAGLMFGFRSIRFYSAILVVVCSILLAAVIFSVLWGNYYGLIASVVVLLAAVSQVLVSHLLFSDKLGGGRC